MLDWSKNIDIKNHKTITRQMYKNRTVLAEN